MMSETKWTPKKAPWPWTFVRNGRREIWSADNNAFMGDESYYPWCPEHDADWHLIAAAPDLYEVLEAALASLDADPSRSPLRDKEARAVQAWLRGMWGDKARAALDKARGE
jgi:hypothetical protein